MRISKYFQLAFSLFSVFWHLPLEPREEPSYNSRALYEYSQQPVLPRIRLRFTPIRPNGASQGLFHLPQEKGFLSEEEQETTKWNGISLEGANQNKKAFTIQNKGEAGQQ